MNSMLSLSVRVKSSATTLSKSSPPEILESTFYKLISVYLQIKSFLFWLNWIEFKLWAYYSVTITISRGLSKAAAKRSSFGCRNMFIIRISSRTCSRSFVLIVLTNFAAKLVPEDFSTTLLTVPYRPLPNSSNTRYRSSNNCPFSISTIRASNGGSNSGNNKYFLRCIQTCIIQFYFLTFLRGTAITFQNKD